MDTTGTGFSGPQLGFDRLPRLALHPQDGAGWRQDWRMRLAYQSLRQSLLLLDSRFLLDLGPATLPLYDYGL